MLGIRSSARNKQLLGVVFVFEVISFTDNSEDGVCSLMSVVSRVRARERTNKSHDIRHGERQRVERPGTDPNRPEHRLTSTRRTPTAFLFILLIAYLVNVAFNVLDILLFSHNCVSFKFMSYKSCPK